jgi:uncharacterized membrane protein
MKLTYTNNELRKFSLVLAFYFVLLVAFISKKAHQNIMSKQEWLIFIITGVFVFILPRLLFPLKIGWDAFLHLLHWINTRILLGILFFLIFTPIAKYRRLLKKDFLRLSYDSSLTTYRIIASDFEKQNDLRRPF